MAWIETGMNNQGEENVEIVTFATGTDEQIAAMLRAYYNDKLSWNDMGWNIGDIRTIHLNEFDAPNPGSGKWVEQDINIIIVAHDHTDLAEPINGHDKACITVHTKEVINKDINNYGTIYINGDSSYDGTFTKWSNLYIRTYLNDKVLGAMQSTFSSMIKPSNHYRHITYDGTEVELVTDNIFLPSVPEIFGTTCSYAYYIYTDNPSTEGTRFEYYANNDTSRRCKYGNLNDYSSLRPWWLGSAGSYYNWRYGFSWLNQLVGGDPNYSLGNSHSGLAPAWAM